MTLTPEIAKHLLAVPEDIDRVLLPMLLTPDLKADTPELQACSFVRKTAIVPNPRLYPEEQANLHRGSITTIDGVECVVTQATTEGEHLIVEAWVDAADA